MYDIVNLFDLNKFKQNISFLLSIFNLMQKTHGTIFIPISAVQGRRMSLISGNDFESNMQTPPVMLSGHLL